MSVGIPVYASDWDNQVGSLARQLNALMEQIQQVYTVYAALGDAGLAGLPLGTRSVAWTSAERTQLESALADMNKLATIYAGTQTQASAYAFNTFTKLVYGFGF